MAFLLATAKLVSCKIQFISFREKCPINYSMMEREICWNIEMLCPHKPSTNQPNETNNMKKETFIYFPISNFSFMLWNRTNRSFTRQSYSRSTKKASPWVVTKLEKIRFELMFEWKTCRKLFSGGNFCQKLAGTCWSVPGQMITIKSNDNCMWAIYSFGWRALTSRNANFLCFTIIHCDILLSFIHSPLKIPVESDWRTLTRGNTLRFSIGHLKRCCRWCWSLPLSLARSLTRFWAFYWPPNFLL